MHLTGNTVLITGGASGIGLALAERFLRRGNEVIVCGRRGQKLQETRARLPALRTLTADVSLADGRQSLLEQVKSDFPDVNVLVNNAGIRQWLNVLDAAEDWDRYHQEIATNLEAPVHLSLLLAPFLAGKANAAIVNVSSGLAFTPMAVTPVYSATKAAVHSFTVSLRHQLQGKVEVIEIVPPAVDTDLGGPGRHSYGVPVDAFADAVFAGLEQGALEISYGTADKARRMSRAEIDATVEMLNNK